MRVWQYRNFHDLGMSWNVMRSLKRLKAVLFIVRTSRAHQGECEDNKDRARKCRSFHLWLFHWWPKEAFSKLLASVSEATEGPEGEENDTDTTDSWQRMKTHLRASDFSILATWVWIEFESRGSPAMRYGQKIFLDAARTSAVCPPSCLAKGWTCDFKLAKMSCPLSCHYIDWM